MGKPGAFTFKTIVESYKTTTPTKIKVLDAYLVFTMISGVLVFLYGVLSGAVPYHSFLAGFISTIGSFVFGMNLRLSNQITTENALSQFILCHVSLFLAVANFIA